MAKSENGWEPARVGADACEWIRVPGAEHVSLQMLKGRSLVIMRAYAADYHAHIEPLRDADSACYTPTNSVATSNHLNGTAMDLNWNSHPFRVDYAGFDPAKIARMRELLAFYKFEGIQIMFWAQDWKSPKDAMHHQMGYNTFQNPGVLDRFITQRISADGFSTYKRGGTTTPPPPPLLSKADQYALAVIAEGRRRGITPRGIQIAFATVFVESGWKMYANSKVPESLKLPHDAVGSDHDSVGLFQQRCPMWGPAEVLMNPALSAGLFYDRLAKMNYNNASRTPGSFAADIQRPAAQYRGRYDERFNDAVALYNRLAGVTPAPSIPGDDMALVPQEQWDRVFRELTQPHPSRSPLRHLDDKYRDTWAGFSLNTDAHGHLARVELLASLGHPESLALLREVAGADPAKYPERQDDALVAQAILARIYSQPAPVTEQVGPAAPAAAQYVPEPQVIERVVYQPEPEPAPYTAVSSTGQLIGQAYDALEQLRLADALPIESRAPLAALISVLQTKNGSQL